MKLKITTSAAILGALTSPALAGSLERNNMPVELLFDSGNVLQFSYTAPSPNLSAAPFGRLNLSIRKATNAGEHL